MDNIATVAQGSEHSGSLSPYPVAHGQINGNDEGNHADNIKIQENFNDINTLEDDFFELELHYFENEKEGYRTKLFMMKHLLKDVNKFQQRVFTFAPTTPVGLKMRKDCSQLTHKVYERTQRICEEITNLEGVIEKKKQKRAEKLEKLQEDQSWTSKNRDSRDIQNRKTNKTILAPVADDGSFQASATDNVSTVNNQLDGAVFCGDTDTSNVTVLHIKDEGDAVVITSSQSAKNIDVNVCPETSQSARSNDVNADPNCSQSEASNDFDVGTKFRKLGTRYEPDTCKTNQVATNIGFEYFQKTNQPIEGNDNAYTIANQQIVDNVPVVAEGTSHNDSISGVGTLTNKEPSSESHQTTSMFIQGSEDHNLTTSESLKESISLGSIDLLLIGNSGNGKSATGNTILKKPVFMRTAASSVASANSAASIKNHWTQICDQIINVIDGPSIDNSGNIKPEDLNKIIEAVGKSLDLCDYSFTALLIPIKFGNRYTKQEAEAIRVIKSVLGKNVIKDYGVCIITHGDNFENAIEEAAEDKEILTFESWLKAQTGDVKNLFEECSYRCVLFDNMTKDVKKIDAQVKKLIEILPKGRRYSKEEFCQADESLQELTQEANLPMLLQQVQEKVEGIQGKLKQIEGGDGFKFKLETLTSELLEQKAIVERINISSPDVESVKLFLQSVEMEINLKIKQLTTSNEIKKLTQKQEKPSRKRDESAQGIALQNHSATIDANCSEIQKSLQQIKIDLEHGYNMFDPELYRYVMTTCLAKLNLFHEQVITHDPESNWVKYLLADIVLLQQEISTNINERKKRLSESRAPCAPNKNMPLHWDAMAAGNGQEGQIGIVHSAPSTIYMIGYSNPAQSNLSSQDQIRRRLEKWYNNLKNYIDL